MFLKKLAVCLITLLPCLPVFAQERYTKKEIKGLLEEKGIAVRQYDIALRYECPQFILVAGIDSDFFAIISGKEYAGILDSPIVAYGKSPAEEKINDTFMTILGYYRNVLEKLMDESGSIQVPDVPDVVAPMMDGIRWGQREPYNNYFPIGHNGTEYTRAPAGCGPVALGQVLKHFKHPAPADPSKLLYDLAVSMNADVGSNVSITRTDSFRPVLVDEYAFSPKIKMLPAGDSRDMSLIFSEIREGRPVILNGHNHFFICDGFTNGYMHLNFGWYGAWDGHYLVPYPADSEKDLWFFSWYAAGLEPDSHADLSKTVYVEIPGTLEELLTKDEKENIHQLVISGKLNGKDIRLLRRMGGNVDDSYYTSWKGSLQRLDMSGAEIMEDRENPYYTADARKTKFSISGKKKVGTEVISYVFHFENLTEEEWKEAVNLGIENTSRYRIRKDGEDYYADYFTAARRIGPSMFINCVNLKEVIIPDDIIEIGRHAFTNTSIKELPTVRL